MYYKSNNAVLSQPSAWGRDTYKIKGIVTYAMNGLFEKMENKMKQMVVDFYG